MSNYKELLNTLCSEINKIVEFIEIKSEKWKRSGNNRELKEVINYNVSIQVSYYKSHRKIIELQAYKDLLGLISSDPILSKGPKKAGHHGKPEVIIQKVIFESFDKEINVFNCEKAISSLTKITKCLNSKKLKYEANARLIGVEIPAGIIKINENVELHKLNETELNERQPIIDFPIIVGFDNYHLTNHLTEIRANFEISLKEDVVNPIIKANGAASSKAKEMFDDVMTAFRLFKSGDIVLGPISGKCDLGSFGSHYQGTSLKVFSDNMHIESNEENSLVKTYKLVENIKSQDKVLYRALNRFLLGKQRIDIFERLVDYVISWEMIVLRNKKSNGPQGELSYRFSINSSSLISSAVKRTNRLKMFNYTKILYTLRSLYVHGEDKDKMYKEINKTEYNNVNELLESFEILFQKVLFWLMSLETNERPYQKEKGWEKLLWKMS